MLVQALAVSVLLHAVLLSSVVNWYPLRLEGAATTINAVISDRRVAAPVPGASPASSPGEVAKPDVPRVVAAPTAAITEMQPRVPLRETSPPAPPGAAGHFPVAPGNGAAALPASGAAAPASSLPNAVSGAAPVGGRPGVSGDDLRLYRLSLASAARSFKAYPALARQRGWEGTVEVALKISAPSPVPEVTLVSTSGHGVLDEQAVDMLTQAARVTALPEGLKARDFRLVLPVQFSLENDQ